MKASHIPCKASPAESHGPSTRRLLSTPSLIAVLAIIGFSLSGCDRTEREQRHPNVVMIIVDDLGWTDVGAYGSTFYQTPAVDRLAEEGVRFTQFYAASPVCSPTRASIMTGRHPARLQITNWIGGKENGLLNQAEYKMALPLNERTIGEVFADEGYATGYIGKWHLGAEGFLPDVQGFQELFAVNQAGQPGSYFPPYENRNWPITNVDGLEGDPEGTYLTDRLTDGAEAFIEAHKDSSFLLVLSHYSVHTPLQGKDSLIAKYTDILESRTTESDETLIPESGRGYAKSIQDHPVYAAMIESTDDSLERVLAALEDAGIDDDTIVVFVSDNGGLSTISRKAPKTATSNVPLRAGKGWMYDGGIRIPMIVRAPGRLQPGISAEPTITMDLLPTLAELAGIPVGGSRPLDGVSIVSALEGNPVVRQVDDALYWHFPHYHHGTGNRPVAAIRVGDYKLIEWLEDGALELYKVAEDVSEANDLADVQPERAQDMSMRLQAWLESVDAKMPTVP